MRVFVIAMEDEAACVRPALASGDRLVVSGVGKVNAAMAAQKAIDAGATEIWNAGFCGGFGADMKPGDCFEVADAVQYDFDLAEVNHTAVGVLDGRAVPEIPLAPRGRFPARRLATGDHFNSSARDYALLAALGCELRDMEGGALAQVCERARVPLHALKCVTNVASRGGMVDQYRDNREYCRTCLTRAVISWI